MSVPMLLYVLLFNYGPLWGWINAFKDISNERGTLIPFLQNQPTAFYGLQNFRNLFGANAITFQETLRNTIAMSLIENMYIKKLVLVSNVMGNKSVIRDGVNGYVCDTAEEYARRIKDAMRHFPQELPEQAYRDVLNIYNTGVMKEKYIRFYDRL